ncbi:FAD-binding oxidoreductase [Crocinitomicaceae bacterium]|nr:FAD-binding oxidoreductase [Crocinitomicaceae bacterium]
MLNIDKTSYWEQKSYFNSIDFLIIGSGIVGYSTALHLRRTHPGAKITIIERGILPSGASSKNAGFACFGSPSELKEDIEQFGEKTVWETVKMRIDGLNYLEKILGTDTLDLKIYGSWDLFTNAEKHQFNNIKPHLPHFNAQLEKITGQQEVYTIDNDLSSKFGFDSIYSAFHNRLEGQIDTSKLNDALHKRAVLENIQILFGIEALSILENQVVTSKGIIGAKKIAICTNGFAQQFLPDEDILPARAQVLITKPIENLKIKGTFHYQAGYYYFRNIDNRILLGGGRNLDKIGETTTSIETTEPIMNRLEELLKTVILPNTPFEIDHSWAGIMGVGGSKKPIIKEVQKNVFCGIRLGGMGIAIGTLVGKETALLME